MFNKIMIAADIIVFTGLCGGLFFVKTVLPWMPGSSFPQTILSSCVSHMATTIGKRLLK